MIRLNNRWHHLNHWTVSFNIKNFYRRRNKIHSNFRFSGYDNSNPHHNNGNNGFNLEATLNNLNGINNILPSVSSSNMMMGMPSLSQSNTLPSSASNSMPLPSDQRKFSYCNQMVYHHSHTIYQSILDFLSGLPTSSTANLPIASSNPIASMVTSTPISRGNSNSMPAGNGTTTPTTGTFRPKPIEELLMSTHDKKDSQLPSTTQTPTNDNKSFIKNDPNVKNSITSSWSLLASAGSPQNTPVSSKPKPAMDSFQQFRNKAKEKADRQKLLEQQELKQRHKEAVEKKEQQKKREEIDRYIHIFGEIISFGKLFIKSIFLFFLFCKNLVTEGNRWIKFLDEHSMT